MRATIVDGNDPVQVRAMAAKIFAGTNLVAIPTETVYGLAANPFLEESVVAVFRVKERPPDNPLILHVPGLEDALPLWADEDRRAMIRARTLARVFWPGPLTIVSWRSVAVPDIVCAGLPKVAVRAPSHPVMAQMFKTIDVPIAAPSANLSGRPSPTTAQDVLETLGDRIDFVVDGGACAHGIESSVVDVTGEHPVLLRPGAIGVSALKGVMSDLIVREPGSAAHDDASPGTRHRHYAPSIAKVRLASPDELATAWSGPATILCRKLTRGRLGKRKAPVFTVEDSPVGFARDLYAMLYRAERERPDELLIEQVPRGHEWLAVRDRLLRATTDGG